MPTYLKRELPANLSDAIAAYRGPITRCDAGERSRPESVMRYAESATTDDMRAYDAGLIIR